MGKMRTKTQSGGPHLLVFYWRVGEILWSKVSVAVMAVKTGRDHSASWVDFLDLGNCLVKRDIE
jgi:hypothetical protein